jgi:hypothetical protein
MEEASGSAFAKSKRKTSAMSACRNLDHFALKSGIDSSETSI